MEIPSSPYTGTYWPARPNWGVKIDGFRSPVLEVSVDDGAGVKFTECAIVHYLSIVIPLTLLSAFLLLFKPRQSTPMKIAEPVPDEGE